MKKVIIKCKLEKPERFIRNLDGEGLVLEKTFWQHDRVYVPRGYQKQSNYPRMILRTEVYDTRRPARYELVLKRHIEDSGVDYVDASGVDNYMGVANMVTQLGFVLKAEVSRRRQEIVISKETVLYIDEVDGVMGKYLKIETALNGKEKVGMVREDLRRTVQTLGAKLSGVTGEIYADMI